MKTKIKKVFLLIMTTIAIQTYTQADLNWLASRTRPEIRKLIRCNYFNLYTEEFSNKLLQCIYVLDVNVVTLGAGESENFEIKIEARETLARILKEEPILLIAKNAKGKKLIDLVQEESTKKLIQKIHENYLIVNNIIEKKEKREKEEN